MRPVAGIPGQLSSTLSSSSIAEANRLVKEVMKEGEQKRGPYKTYSPSMRSEIGKHASDDSAVLCDGHCVPVMGVPPAAASHTSL